MPLQLRFRLCQLGGEAGKKWVLIRPGSQPSMLPPLRFCLCFDSETNHVETVMSGLGASHRRRLEYATIFASMRRSRRWKGRCALTWRVAVDDPAAPPPSSFRLEDQRDGDVHSSGLGASHGRQLCHRLGQRYVRPYLKQHW